MNYNDLKLVATALEQILQNGPDTEGVGLCSNLLDVCFELEPNHDIDTNIDITHVLTKLVEHWPHHSQSTFTPVPGNKGQTPGETYRNAAMTGTLWSRQTEYGRLRWELLEYAVGEAQRLLAEMEAQQKDAA